MRFGRRLPARLPGPATPGSRAPTMTRPATIATRTPRFSRARTGDSSRRRWAESEPYRRAPRFANDRRGRRPLGAMDLARYRDEFPVLATKAYLISASLGPVSNRALAHLREYLDAWAGKGAPDHVWFEHVFPRMRGLKATFGALVGADPEELAITVNVSLALAAIASCVDFSTRRKVILTELDFPTDGHVWLANRARGAEVVFLPSPDGLTVPLEAFEEAIDENTAVVNVTRVLYRSSAL